MRLLGRYHGRNGEIEIVGRLATAARLAPFRDALARFATGVV